MSVPSLSQLLHGTVNALEASRSNRRTGDALLPALVCIDSVFLTLSTIAQRTGVPLSAGRRSRRRYRMGEAQVAGTGDAGSQSSQLALALQKLGEQLAGTQASSSSSPPLAWTGARSRSPLSTTC